MAKAEKLRNLTDCSSIELKLISCKDLKAFNFFQKLSVYAVVSVFNDEMKKEEQQKHVQRQKTPVDKDGDGNPEWNHMMEFDTKEISLADNFDHLFIKFDMRCEGIIFGKKSLGKVRVPFTDLIEDQFNEAVRFVSYQVRTSDGKANGVLNFSYKLITKKKKSDVRIHDSLESDSSSELTNVCDKKIQSFYPTLDLKTVSPDISYPSLADVTSPLPKITVPSPKFNNCHWQPESYNISLPSLLPFSLPAAVHPCQLLPFVQSPGMYQYPPEFTNYGNYSFCGNPGMAENNGHDEWRISGPGNRSDVLSSSRVRD